jgi:trans-aconitate methyltransferase
VTSRQRSNVFGEVAADYDAARAAYAPELVDAVVEFAGRRPRSAVEVGAGTGLATEAFARLGTPITCVEPDPEMAAVLAGKFAANPHVEVAVGRFEDWQPPAGGVDLIYCAQAWHWVDPYTRFQLAHDALAAGGVLALCGHEYGFADQDLHAALVDVYRELAPSLVEEITPAASSGTRWEWSAVESSALWSRTATASFVRLEPYPTTKYVTLMSTFSAHRMLAPDVLHEVSARVAEVIDAHGGVVVQRLLTWLEMARRAD